MEGLGKEAEWAQPGAISREGRTAVSDLEPMQVLPTAPAQGCGAPVQGCEDLGGVSMSCPHAQNRLQITDMPGSISGSARANLAFRILVLPAGVVEHHNISLVD